MKSNIEKSHDKVSAFVDENPQIHDLKIKSIFTLYQCHYLSLMPANPKVIFNEASKLLEVSGWNLSSNPKLDLSEHGYFNARTELHQRHVNKIGETQEMRDAIIKEWASSYASEISENKCYYLSAFHDLKVHIRLSNNPLGNETFSVSSIHGSKHSSIVYEFLQSQTTFRTVKNTGDSLQYSLNKGNNLHKSVPKIQLNMKSGSGGRDGFTTTIRGLCSNTDSKNDLFQAHCFSSYNLRSLA